MGRPIPNAAPAGFEIVYVYDASATGPNHGRCIDADYWEWLFAMLEGTGVTFMYRMNLAGRAFYPSRLVAPFDHASVDRANPEARRWYQLSDMLTKADPLAEAVRAAHRHGIRFWAWWNWNEWQNVRVGHIDVVDRVPIEGMLEQIDVAERAGATGVLLHSIEMFTAWDSGGRPVGGYGVLPRTEYLDALRERACRRAPATIRPGASPTTDRA